MTWWQPGCLTLVLLIACGADVARPHVVAYEAETQTPAVAPVVTVDAAIVSVIEVPDASAAEPTTRGEGSCHSDADCVLGEVGFNCHASPCSRVARSREREAAWQREFHARCGPSGNRMPCPMQNLGTARCVHDVCAAALDDLLE